MSRCISRITVHSWHRENCTIVMKWAAHNFIDRIRRRTRVQHEAVKGIQRRHSRGSHHHATGPGPQVLLQNIRCQHRAAAHFKAPLPSTGQQSNPACPRWILFFAAHGIVLPSALRTGGYRSSYIGKWHLSHGEKPDMEAYGYSDWEGNDRHFMGLAGTGVHFDPILANNAAHWLRANAGQTEPWFLTVALVNPHDVMWYPADQPAYGESHPEDVAHIRRILSISKWKEDEPLPVYDEPYEEIFEKLPANFHDDLSTKPEAQRQWDHDQQHSLWGYIDPKDEKAWLRHLDYYVALHRKADESLGVVLAALEETGHWEDTVVIFTSDHGDMCGSHGLRSKGPFVYDEIMRVPAYVKVPGVTQPGSRSSALSSHVDLAATIVSLGGVTPPDAFSGVDLTPVLTDPDQEARDHVLFALDAAHTDAINKTRYAVRGFFDGRYKYARYYGKGGGIPSTGLWGAPKGEKEVPVDAPFEDQEHELYDHAEDPLELVNLANDPAHAKQVREQHARLLAWETDELAVP